MTKFSSKLIALLVAAVAFTGGAQALVPAPAMAVVNEGEECDPNYPSADCEPNGGGGGGSGTGTQDGGDGPTVGSETIEVHDTPPSRCVVSPSSCLPRELGGPSRGVQADRSPRQPQRGGRPNRQARPSPVGSRTKCEGAIHAREVAEAELNHFRWYEFKEMSMAQRFRHRSLRSEVSWLKSKRENLRELLPELRVTKNRREEADEVESILVGLEVELVEASESLDTLAVPQKDRMYSRLNSLESAFLAAFERVRDCEYQRTNPSPQGPPSDGK